MIFLSWKFSPEFELVTSPGQAYEAEFPMDGNDLEAFKFAGQLTATDEPFFKDGVQVFAEVFRDRIPGVNFINILRLAYA